MKLALGSVVIVGDQIQYLQRVQIQSSATPPAATGPLGAKPSSLSFTSATNGVTSGDAQSITLTNNGTTPLTAITPQIAGTNKDDFKLVQPVNAADACPSPLAPSGTCKISVTYGPPSTTVGAGSTRTADLQISYDPGSTPLAVALSGAASDTVYFSATALSLGTATTAKPSTETLTITNFKDTAVTLSVANPTGTNAAEFTPYSNNNCGTAAAPVPVAINQSCSVKVTLTPAAAGEGARSATMTVTYTISGAAQTQTVSLTGTGQ